MTSGGPAGFGIRLMGLLISIMTALCRPVCVNEIRIESDANKRHRHYLGSMKAFRLPVNNNESAVLQK